MNGIYTYLRRLLGTTSRPMRRHTTRRCQLRVEALEDRCVPAAVHTFVVTTTAYTPDLSHLRFDIHGHAYNTNGSPVSLFEAIAAIDAVSPQTGKHVYPGSSEIDFAIAGSGVHTFVMPAGSTEPTERLAQDNVTINGYTQPGSSMNTSTTGDNAHIDVQLNFRLDVRGSGTIIRGVSVRGIDLENGHGNEVLGDFIGVTPAGTSMGADQAGVTIGAATTSTTHANNDWIGTLAAGDRNVIAGHIGTAGNGVWIGAGSVTNNVENNLIGTAPNGTSALGNAGAGVTFDASATANNVVTRNTIAFNHGAGIQLAGGAQNSFSGNAVFSNSNGITLAPTANKGIAAPVLTTWTPTTVTGHLTGFTSGATYRLDFYNNLQTDAAGHYEGQVPWTSMSVIPDSHGNFTVTVTQPTTGGLTATVTDPQHDTSAFSAATDFNLTSYSGPTLHLVEGTAASHFLAGTITHDGNPNASASLLQATVYWGDGTHAVITSQPSSAGQIVLTPYHSYQILGNHTYAEEGSYTITATVVDTQTHAQNTAIHTVVQVADAPLAVTPAAISATEAAVFQGSVATFKDQNPGAAASQFTATIHWGDGTTTAGTIAALTSGFGVAGSHTYASAGTYTVTVTVTDVGGAKVTGTLTATVADAALTPQSSTLTPTEGTTFTGAVGSFTDPGGWTAANYTAVITWGDGTTTTASTAAGTIVPAPVALGMTPGSPAPVAQFEVMGTNTYAAAGTYPVSIVVTDAGGATTTINSTANVADAPLTPQSTSVAPTEGTAFTGAIGSFSDPGAGAAPSYTAVITWGDGNTTTASTAAGTIVRGPIVDAIPGQPLPPPMFTVLGTNTYATAGTYPVSIAVTDAGGATTTINSTADVADAPLTAIAATVNATVGTTFTGPLGTFTDAGGPALVGNYTATIDWADNTTPSTGVISVQGSTFTITGTHTYASAGTMPITVQIADAGGASTTLTIQATVGGIGG